MEAKASPWKRNRVEELTNLLTSGGTIGIVDVVGVPATLMLGMRASLKDKMTMTMAKKRLLKIAWEKAGLDYSDLENMLEGSQQPVLVQTNDIGPYDLYKEMEATKTGRAPKGGDTAPIDIVVDAGPTGFPPGPIVGELNSVGIPAKIMKGEVHVQKQSIPAREGDVISTDLALMLDKLSIHPIEIGLKLNGVIEGGIFLPPEDLDLDIDAFKTTIHHAISQAFNVACKVTWFTDQTMPTLLSMAEGQATSVALEAGWASDKTTPILIARANSTALGLASSLATEALDEELQSALSTTVTAPIAVVAEESGAPEAAEAEPEEEEEEEEAGFDGLGDLFG